MDNEINLLKQVLNKARIKIDLKHDSNTLARAEVSLGNIFNIKGWRVSQSTYGEVPYVQPPSMQNPNKTWLKIVWIEDKEIKDILDNRILNAYETSLAHFKQEESKQ